MIIKLATFESELEKEAGLFSRMAKGKAVQLGQDAVAKVKSGKFKDLTVKEIAYLDTLNAGRKIGRHTAAAEAKLTGKVNENVSKAVDYLKEKGTKAGETIKNHSGAALVGGGVLAGGGALAYGSRKKK